MTTIPTRKIKHQVNEPVRIVGVIVTFVWDYHFSYDKK